MYGTGLAGSLTYSSNALVRRLAGRLEGELAARRGNRATAAWPVCGGQASYFRHSLVPVSKTQASGSFGRALALQVELEERQLDLLAVEFGGLGVERHVAERRRRRRRAQPPWTRGP